MLLYICSKCHRWCNMQLTQYIMDSLQNALGGKSGLQAAQASIYNCAFCGGVLVQVDANARLMIMEDAPRPEDEAEKVQPRDPIPFNRAQRRRRRR